MFNSRNDGPIDITSLAINEYFVIMFYIDNLKEGVRCTVTFHTEDGLRSYPESELRFDTVKGGILKIPMRITWHTNLKGVTATLDGGKVYIPEAQNRGGDPFNREDLKVFSFDHALAGNAEQNPETDLFNRVEMELDWNSPYLEEGGVKTLTRDIDHMELKCSRSDQHHVILPGVGRTWINVGFHIRPEGSRQQTVIACNKVFIDFEESCIVDEMIPAVSKIANFWEFMMHRPQDLGAFIYRGKEHGRQAHHLQQQKMPSATGKAWYQTGLLQLSWTTCQEHLEKLLQCWMTLDHGSPWMDNLLRLIWYRDFPADVRFFMAYTALQGFRKELGIAPGIEHKFRIEEDRLWFYFEHYWGHLLFPLSPSRDNAEILRVARSYTDRLVRKRHHFAHPSMSRQDILAGEDLEIAFQRLVMILKGMFLHAAGLPTATWKGIIEQWAVQIQLEVALSRN